MEPGERWNVNVNRSINTTHHLPDLHDVVLGDRADYPGFIGVPREIRDLCRVTAVNELKHASVIYL